LAICEIPVSSPLNNYDNHRDTVTTQPSILHGTQCCPVVYLMFLVDLYIVNNIVLLSCTMYVCACDCALLMYNYANVVVKYIVRVCYLLRRMSAVCVTCYPYI